MLKDCISSQKEKENGRHVFLSLIKHEIRKIHIIVVQ